MTDADVRLRFWRQCRTRGLIPGPLETEKQFLARVAQAKPICTLNHAALGKHFSVQPDWLDIRDQSPQIRFWEGAATVIDCNQQGVFSSTVELGTSLLLAREDILAHEAIHAIRCAFDDSLAEELIAWKTCPQKWISGFSILNLDFWQLLLTILAMFSIFWGFLSADPTGFLFASLLSTMVVARFWWCARPLYRASGHLKARGWPSWALLLHLSWDEIKALSCNPDRFWSQFSEKSHFRFEFMHATFGMLIDN
jgi:hypothetical protein